MHAQRTTHSELETIDLASALGAKLLPGDVVLLAGELGAGKTQFVKGLAIGLGHTDANIASPTYVLLHCHESPNATPLLHVDAYRMGEHDAQTLGLDASGTAQAVLVVEWPERMTYSWPVDTTLCVTLEHAGEHQRCITYDVPDAIASRLAIPQESP